MQVLISVFLLACLALACSADYAFDNPVDPECKNKDNPSACTATTGSAGTATSSSGPGAPSGSETSTSSGTTTTTNAVAGSVYNFVNSFSVTPSGCSKVGKVQVFENGTELMIFVLATCSDRAHVYAYKASYAGVASSTPIMLTSDCNSGTTGINDFTVDKGPNNYLLAYVCKISSSSFVTKVATVSTTVNIGTSTTYETLSTAKGYRLAWNSSSNTFGLAKSGVFQRFNESGSTAGGPVTLNSVYPKQFDVVDGQWLIVDYYYYATTISPSGTLGCDKVNTLAKFGGGLMAFHGTQKIILMKDGYLASQDIVPSTCITIGDRSDYVKLTNIGNSLDIRSNSLLNSTIGALLFTNGKGLILATYPRLGTYKIHAENSVAGYTETMNSAEVKVIQSKLYVAYDKDGAGYVSYSNETVP